MPESVATLIVFSVGAVAFGMIGLSILLVGLLNRPAGPIAHEVG